MNFYLHLYIMID